MQQSTKACKSPQDSLEEWRDNDKTGRILMSKHVREESEFRQNEWLVLEIRRRTENEEETNKKDERNQKVKMCLCGTSSGYYLLTS